MNGTRRVFVAVAMLGIIPTAFAGCSAHDERRPPKPVAVDDGAERNDDNEPPPTPTAGPVDPGGNQHIRSFDEAKRVLSRIYDRHRVDLYCGCSFVADPGHGFKVDLAGCGYVVAQDATRAGRIEWEHAVAAATFGRTFTEWTVGGGRCVDGKGKRFKGRKCAGLSPEFARIEGDMHNLFPVVGEVNGIRGDLPMGILDPPDRAPAHRKESAAVFTFGACKSAIERGVFLPRAEIRGDLARASLYMDRAYPSRHILDDAHRAMFERWSADDPPDAWERERNRAIAELQGNGNPFIDATGR